MSMLGENFSFYTTEEMKSFFQDHPEVIENTLKVADKCNLELKFGEVHLPYYEVPKGKSDFEVLSEFCYSNVEKRYDFDDFA